MEQRAARVVATTGINPQPASGQCEASSGETPDGSAPVVPLRVATRRMPARVGLAWFDRALWRVPDMFWFVKRVHAEARRRGGKKVIAAALIPQPRSC